MRKFSSVECAYQSMPCFTHKSQDTTCIPRSIINYITKFKKKEWVFCHPYLNTALGPTNAKYYSRRFRIRCMIRGSEKGINYSTHELVLKFPIYFLTMNIKLSHASDIPSSIARAAHNYELRNKSGNTMSFVHFSISTIQTILDSWISSF